MNEAKRAEAARNPEEASSPRSGETLPITFGAPQGSAMPPAAFISLKRGRQPSSTGSSTSSTSSSKATRPLPTFRNSAQGTKGPAKIQPKPKKKIKRSASEVSSTSGAAGAAFQPRSPSDPPPQRPQMTRPATGAVRGPFQPRSPSNPPPQRQQLQESPGTCHGYAKRLALAGAKMEREDIEPERPKTEVLRTEEDASEQDYNPAEEEPAQEYDPREDHAEEANNGEAKMEEEKANLVMEEADLILNISDQDRLDFEPVEPDERILDETKEVNLLTNMYSSLRTRFRMIRRPGLPRTRSETAPEPEKRKLNVHECNLLYEDYPYLFHQLTYFILYYLYFWQSSLDANQFASRLLIVCQ